MIALDTNIFVYAHRNDIKFHEKARSLVETKAMGNERWAIPWPCVHEFLSVVTNPKIFKTPTPLDLAVKQVQTWLKSPSSWILAEAEGYWEVLMDTLLRAHVTGAKVHDARIVALCRYHGVDELWYSDRDFGRFSDLKTTNPLCE